MTRIDGPRAETLNRQIDLAARDFMADPRTVGLSVGVACEGVTAVRHFGEVVRGSRRSPTDTTLYEIGSISKTFVGLMLARAELSGRLQLVDDVRRFLSGDYPNLECQGRPVRLWHLIDHLSGLPFLLPDRPALFAKPDFETLPAAIVALLAGYTRADFMRDLHAVVIDQLPGQAFRYSNAGAMLAGYILEDLYGLSFEQLLQVHIAQPLGLRFTTSLLPPIDTDAASGHTEKGQIALANPVEMNAAGGIRSTPADMLRYVERQLDESDPAIERSHRLRWGDAAAHGVGLNWQIAATAGQRRIWQSGGTFGFASYCVLYPAMRTGIVLLSNESDPGTQGRLEGVADRVLAEIRDQLG